MTDDIQTSEDLIASDDERKQARFLWLSELAMVGGSVLVFFAFLTLLIRAYFPEGTSLVLDPDASLLTDASRSGNVELGIDSQDGGVEQLFAGEIL